MTWSPSVVANLPHRLEPPLRLARALEIEHQVEFSHCDFQLETLALVGQLYLAGVHPSDVGFQRRIRTILLLFNIRK